MSGETDGDDDDNNKDKDKDNGRNQIKTVWKVLFHEGMAASSAR